ncbi:Apolipoprotein N-acyltransferase [Methylobacillus rhizosphaerae]|uniref:Apolipoprotein N-acyltransferase n=1 Tax=Methylobacillus rhizosphaerae TaxID=551994 RepID=A0A239ABM7_9PROT|nr:apolipoprotein N-acyltransferase [Methylobacillus rhizosphaerae]SNR93000.1 Apolipoprotein N-acyltransferase [Methylobacillus rhizosphaerae]
MKLSRPGLLHLIALLAGAFSVTGFAPFYWYPATILGLAGLVYLWHLSDTPRQAWWIGFCFGLGLFGAGIYWIYISLHDFGDMPAAMAVIATFLLSAFLALFPATTGWAARKTGHLWLSIPVLWVLSEWVRGWIFTGFPWLLSGYSQIPGSPLAGFAPVLGIHGVSLGTILSASIIAAIVVYWRHPVPRRNSLLLLAILWATGGLLKLAPWSMPAGAPTSVALLQGNLTQDLKWETQTLRETLQRYLDMTLGTQAKLIILPETAFPLVVSQMPADYLKQLADHARSNGGDILIGTVEEEDGHYYNSMLSMGSSPEQAYRKTHLVPFGEFIPLKQVFGWVYENWLNIPLTDISRGGFQQRPMQIAGQAVAINICYEDVFGEEIILQLPEAGILVNTSNDAWYGDSIAAYQHLQIAQARSMETARMMLRATNTGATAIIRPDGTLAAHAPHFETTILEGEAQAYQGTTPYVRWGNWPILIALFTSLGLLWRRKKK